MSQDKLKIEPFQISIEYEGTGFHLRVEQAKLTESMEVFLVSSSRKRIEVHSNRPLLRKQSAKKRIDFKVRNGMPKHKHLYDAIVVMIESKIKESERPRFDWSDHPKNRPDYSQLNKNKNRLYNEHEDTDDSANDEKR